MNLPDVVTKGEWEAARKDLLAKEKEFTKARDALNTERRRLPMVEIRKEYIFEGPDGPVKLVDLFEGRHQLIVYHFMFDPEWDEGCSSCSFLADHIGELSHLHSRNTTLAMVSRAPLEKIEAYKRRMGWTMPWYSSFASDFNYDFHVTLDSSRGPLEYNFRDIPTGEIDDGSCEAPGTSVFLRDGDRIFHTYSSYARGGDILLNTYNYLDLTPLGRQEDWEEPAGRSEGLYISGFRRHDEYDQA
jgi:predicted dithiol-disulfide oxidoreductase (DUF899 family)